MDGDATGARPRLVWDAPTSSLSPLQLCGAFAAQGVAFVDNSSSTNGEVLATLQEFTELLCPAKTALWNSQCGPLASTHDTVWASTGCSSPRDIYKKHPDPQGWSAFGLFTDGGVSPAEVAELSRHACKTAHLPTVLGLALHSTRAATAIKASECNISVVLSHYVSARDALVVVFSPVCAAPPDACAGKGASAGAGAGAGGGLALRVLAAKGAWRASFPGLPELGTDPDLSQFPLVRPQDLQCLATRRHAPQLLNHMLIGGGTGRRERMLDLDSLLGTTDPAAVLDCRLSTSELDDAARACHSQGRVSEFRAWLGGLAGDTRPRSAQPGEGAAHAGHTDTLLGAGVHTGAGERDYFGAWGPVGCDVDVGARHGHGHGHGHGQHGHGHGRLARRSSCVFDSITSFVDSGLRAASFIAASNMGMGADILGSLSREDFPSAQAMGAVGAAPLVATPSAGTTASDTRPGTGRPQAAGAPTDADTRAIMLATQETLQKMAADLPLMRARNDALFAGIRRQLTATSSAPATTTAPQQPRSHPQASTSGGPVAAAEWDEGDGQADVGGGGEAEWSGGSWSELEREEEVEAWKATARHPALAWVLTGASTTDVVASDMRFGRLGAWAWMPCAASTAGAGSTAGTRPPAAVAATAATSDVAVCRKEPRAVPARRRSDGTTRAARPSFTEHLRPRTTLKAGRARAHGVPDCSSVLLPQIG